MNNNVIISCPVTGSGDTAKKHPNLPITPKQIAEAAIEAAKAGAAIAHIHVREPNGAPSRKLEYYKEVADRVRSNDTDVVINFTGGDTWVPSFKVTRRGGKILTCGATAGFDPKTDLRYVWTFELKILGSNSWLPEDLETLMKMISDGRLSPIIDTVLPLEKTADGVKLLEDREVIGKIIITP